MERYQVIPRSLCFVFHQHQVLMLKANSSKEWAGRFDPVGGHIEANEDVLASGIREIKEESGLDVVDAKVRGVIHVSNFFGKNIMLFIITATATSTDIISNHEGELTWVSLAELDSINTFADIKPILERILKDNSFFTGNSKFDQGDLIEINL